MTIVVMMIIMMTANEQQLAIGIVRYIERGTSEATKRVNKHGGRTGSVFPSQTNHDVEELRERKCGL